MIEQITAVRYKCTCDHPICAHKWESDSIPERCAKCKKPTWNRAPLRNRENLQAFGKSQTITAWARQYNVDRRVIHARIKRGWTVEDAISKPVRKKACGPMDFGVTEYDPETGCRPNSHMDSDGTIKAEIAKRIQDNDFDVEIVSTMTPAEVMERYPDLEVDVDAEGLITGMHRRVEV